MKPRYGAHGHLSFWFVLPTTNLRRFVERKLREQFPELNYHCDWKDVHGWGLHLAYAPAWDTTTPEYQRARKEYVIAHAQTRSYLYKNPAFDLVNI